jgi:hypothetical protein
LKSTAGFLLFQQRNDLGKVLFCPLEAGQDAIVARDAAEINAAGK